MASKKPGTKRQSPFDALGLSTDATEDDVQRAFRSLARRHHPDRGGNESTMKELVAARDKALAEVRRRDGTLQEVLSSALERQAVALTEWQRRSQESKRVLEQVVRQRTTRLRQLRRITIFLAVVSGGLTLFSSGVLPDFPRDEYWRTMLSFGFGSLALATGAYALIFHSAIGSIRTATEDAADALSERFSYSEVLVEMESETDGETPWNQSDWWSREQLETFIQQWSGAGGKALAGPFWFFPAGSYSMRRLARHVGSVAFVKLFLSKGLENGMVATRESFEGRRLRTDYQVNSRVG